MYRYCYGTSLAMLCQLEIDGVPTVITDESWKEAKKGLERRLQIDVPGTGIAFAIPMSAIGGKKVDDVMREMRWMCGKL